MGAGPESDRIMASLIAAIVAEHTDAWIDLAPGDPQARVDTDLALVESVIADPGACRLRIWTNARCVVVGCGQARMPGFADLAAKSRATIWPVVARASGGTAVVHRPGVLNISLVRARLGHAIEADYANLVRLIASAAATLGVAVGHGSVPGASCDGRWNLVVGGRKLAGTAAATRTRGGVVGSLVHASLTLNGDVVDVSVAEKVNAALGRSARVSCHAHTGLLDVLPPTSELFA